MKNYKTEDFFPPAIKYFGYLLILVGILLLLVNFIASIIILFVGFLFGFTFYGVLLNKGNKEYREYTSVLGLKFGKWESLTKFSCLSILTRTLGYKVLSRAQLEASVSNKYFEVYLLNQNHRVKLLLNRFKSYEKAKKEVEILEDYLDLQLEVYSPS